MTILFDQGTPVPLRAALVGHTVDTAYERGWSTLSNVALLDAAEASSFDVFITTDHRLRIHLVEPGVGHAVGTAPHVRQHNRRASVQIVEERIKPFRRVDIDFGGAAIKEMCQAAGLCSRYRGPT